VKVNIISIGNPKGIRIPEILLEQVHLNKEADLVVEGAKLVIRPVKKAREGRAKAFKYDPFSLAGRFNTIDLVTAVRPFGCGDINCIFLAFLLMICLLNSGTSAFAAAPDMCSPAKLQEVLAPASSSSPTVNVACNLNLKKGDSVTKRMILEGSSATGITVNCNSATLNGGPGTVNDREAMIEIRSIKYKSAGMGTPEWDRPEDVTIKNCIVIGSVHVWGMAINGQGADLRDSSRLPGHVERARKYAPTRITLDHLIITAAGTIPLYLAPGVTNAKLINSELKGTSSSVAIYLDAESYGNIIKGNYIHTVTSRGREVMAIDGSSHNMVTDNRFSELKNGGIYLYRNCGEGGTIRHSTPSYNRIINNVFYYDVYRGPKPAIYLGARDGNKRYCYDDKGYPYGSSVSDLDYAKYNVVMQNQIYKRSVSDMIRVRNIAINSPNYLSYNEAVVVETKRFTGCFISNEKSGFIRHGEVVEDLLNTWTESACHGGKYECNDGNLICLGDSQ
jgi:hypothetical protein